MGAMYAGGKVGIWVFQVTQLITILGGEWEVLVAGRGREGG